MLTRVLLPILLLSMAELPAQSEAAQTWRPPAEASLPEGFPPPTPPGELRLKHYPSVRGAWVEVEGRLAGGLNAAFWPLFRHIQRQGIAMTAPVVADYASEPARSEAGRMEVAFLYPNQRMGRTSSDSSVAVRDSAPLLVVSIGVTGPYDLPTMRRALERLELWLHENGGTWERAGSPRRLMYQNPTWRNASRLYSEVEIPIAPVQRPQRSQPGRGLLVVGSGRSGIAGLFGDRARPVGVLQRKEASIQEDPKNP